MCAPKYVQYVQHLCQFVSPVLTHLFAEIDKHCEAVHVYVDAIYVAGDKATNSIFVTFILYDDMCVYPRDV